MASKETTAAGFANVNREITGELPTRDDFFGESVFLHRFEHSRERERMDESSSRDAYG